MRGGGEGCGWRGDRDGAAGLGDGGHGRVGAQARAGLFGEAALGGDDGFGADVAGLRLEIAVVGVAERPELRVAVAQGGGVEAFVRDGEACGEIDGAGEEVAVAMQRGGAGGGADDQHAGADQQGLAGFGFEIGQDGVAAAGERDVGRAFADCLAGEAGAAMAGAVFVRWIEAVDAEDGDVLAGELEEGGHAGGAEADDDDVGGVGHGRPSRKEGQRFALDPPGRSAPWTRISHKGPRRRGPL